MTDEEKKSDPEFHVRGGYLKTLEYKEAFQASYAKTSQEDKDKLLKLPNFDAEVFKEISGIDVTEKESYNNTVIEVDGKKYRLQEV